MAGPSPSRWRPLIILLHWSMAAALLAMIVGGFVMTVAAKAAIATGDWEARILGLPIFEAFQLHKLGGVTLWVLVLICLVVARKIKAARPSVKTENDQQGKSVC